MRKADKRKAESLPEEILGELAAIGLARATDCLCICDGKVELKESGAIKGDGAAAIAAIEKTAGGWKVKFYDKLKALELLGNHLGMFGTGQAQETENNLLEAILLATREDLDTDDIPELQ